MDKSDHAVTQHCSLGLFWIFGWLFTAGYLELNFLKGAFALLIWPYFLGQHFAG